jgi:hypothetical protein
VADTARIDSNPHLARWRGNQFSLDEFQFAGRSNLNCAIRGCGHGEGSFYDKDINEIRTSRRGTSAIAVDASSLHDRATAATFSIFLILPLSACMLRQQPALSLSGS